MTDYSDWIGRSTVREDIVAPRLLAEYRATLDGTLAPLNVPPGVEFCLAPDICAPNLLGRDGHPRTGQFLPALPLPRRMWAGGRIDHVAPLAPGDTITRTSTIEDVAFKTGRSGQLGFVTVRHTYAVAGQTRISSIATIPRPARPPPTCHKPRHGRMPKAGTSPRPRPFSFGILPSLSTGTVSIMTRPMPKTSKAMSALSSMAHFRRSGCKT